jgi:predicted permease
MRTREISLRAALGASRARLFWQASAESLVLAAVGGTAGVLLSFALVDLFRSFAPANVPRLDSARPDGRVIAIMLAVAFAVTFLSGLAASFGLARRNVRAGLGSGARTGTGRRQTRTRGALIAVETALSLALLFAAGLLLRSLGELYRVDLGFAERDVVRFSLNLPASRYGDLGSVTRFYATLEEQLALMPGVESVGSVRGAPLAGGNVGGPVFIEGRPADPGREPYAAVRPITPGYMATLGLTILQGRGLQPSDNAGGEAVAVVNERFVAENFPNGDPIGARFDVMASYGFGSPTWTIIGVVRDVRRSLAGEPIAELYVPHARFGPGFMQVHLRGADIASVVPGIRAIVNALDPMLPVTGVETMRDAIRRDAGSVRFYLILLGGFAVLAAILATVGVYGVVAYVVGGRRREIGVRIALGARRSEIHRMFLWWGGRHAIAGVALGIAGSVLASRYLQSVIFNVRSLDPLVLTAAAAVVLATSAAAVILPARAATRIDPGAALRPD